MFERFTKDAREIVVRAQEEAKGLGHAHIGTEHLLLSLIGTPGTPSASALGSAGLDYESVRRVIAAATPADGLDAAALSSIGIDLGAVRDKVEQTFGAGALDAEPARGRGSRSRHIPFTRPAKKSLELALREALRLNSKEIRDAHLLLGVLREGDGLGFRTIAGSGINVDDLRGELERAGGKGDAPPRGA